MKIDWDFSRAAEFFRPLHNSENARDTLCAMWGVGVEMKEKPEEIYYPFYVVVVTLKHINLCMYFPRFGENSFMLVLCLCFFFYAFFMLSPTRPQFVFKVFPPLIKGMCVWRVEWVGSGGLMIINLCQVSIEHCKALKSLIINSIFFINWLCLSGKYTHTHDGGKTMQIFPPEWK